MSNNNSQNFMNWENLGKALITGASSGIGSEFARQLAKQGFDLILIARRKEKLEKLKEEFQDKYHISIEILVADLSILSKNQEIADKISKLDNL
jgi:short-subunit dehydrogenase